MNALSPLEAAYEEQQGSRLPLPSELERLYGELAFPEPPGRPHVFGNFVTTLDGVVSLNLTGQASGGPISGSNPHDRLVMALLRAAADAVIVGAGTVRAAHPDHLWIAERVDPARAGAYHALRAALGKPGPPLTVIVTARGDLDPERRIFRPGAPPVLIVTTTAGAEALRERGLPSTVPVAVAQSEGRLSARSILAAASRARASERVLVEGGPHLLGDFFAEECLDELFLTLAPQIAGRDSTTDRPALVEGKTFAPEHPLWGTLAGVKRGGSHLFLRYSFRR